MSALFSALAMALAALARSSKEGQYYLIPLLMLMLPLMMIASLPSARLDLGTSLIPVSGMMLLQRTLIEGDLARAARFAGPVAAVTLICCWLAARWAVWQFKSETVLFRSGERFGVGLWFRQLIRDRGPLPTVGEALLCGVLILVMRFCVGMSGGLDLSWSSFAKQAVIIQVATVAVPTILMTLFLTRMPRRTLRLAGARVGVVAAAILAAIALHPAMTLLSGVVMEVYPASAELTQANQVLAALIDAAPGIVAVLLVFALVPAICEELAFRGFILSGLQSLRGTWTPILLTSLLFGLTHGILQQSLIALVTGTVLGVIAVRTGSLWPCIAFHATHNALSILVPRLRFDVPGSPLAPFFQHVVDTSGVVQVSYQPLGGALLTLLGGLVMVWLWKSGSRDKAASGTALPVPAEA
jgi:sodium transport system permease protein